MSTSPSAFKLFNKYPPSSSPTFTSPSNHRSLPSPVNVSNYSIISSVSSKISLAARTFLSLLSFLDPFQSIPTHFPLPLLRIASISPISRLIAYSHLYSDSHSNGESETDSQPMYSEGVGVTVLASATTDSGTIGIHQPDQVHGRPDQQNFADGAGGPGTEIGQNTYAKQC